MVSKYISILLLTFLISCSSSKESSILVESNSNIHFTKSEKGNISVIIPNGWKEIRDNVNQLFEIWLVNKKNNAVISFIPITIEDSLSIPNSKKKLSVLSEILNMRRLTENSDIEIVKEEEIKEKYSMRINHLLINNYHHNSIVFSNNNYYYESLAYFDKKYKPSETEVNDLIELQKKVVSDLIFR